MNLLELYRAYNAPGETGKQARDFLEQAHWYAVNAEFDPKTGDALPQSLSSFLKKVCTSPQMDSGPHDRLWRITEHCRASVERLFHGLNESPRREHALLPVHSVRELDASSFIKLSNRPGRTIREKLAGKPYMQAVRRYQSVDLPENRLLKAFVRHLAELLELRLDCLGYEDELLPKIQSWLHSNEAQAIGNWDNLPPNNTLLSHRDYRRIWDAWRWLQALDDNIAADFTMIEKRTEMMCDWTQHAQKWFSGKYLFAEMPLLFDYDKFEIIPWAKKTPLCKHSEQYISKLGQRTEITEPACIDFTFLRPRYACDTQNQQCLADLFLWQQWQRDGECIDIELFNADAVWLHPDATAISAPDLLFSDDNASENSSRAAGAFVSHLKSYFKSETLIWLVPDNINDLKLKVIRSNLNAHFANSTPLPRSIAAVFAKVDLARISEGFSVLVVDSAGGQTFATKLIAKFDQELKQCLPEIHGLYWERCPSVIISNTDYQSISVGNSEIATVDENTQWFKPTSTPSSDFIGASSLKKDQRIGDFALLVNLEAPPVNGGIRVYNLQQRARNIPIWRDQIPELSIKVKKDGIYQRFELVGKNTTIRPIRGRTITIPITEDFTLPAQKSYYSFPLYIGSNADDLGFSARLDSREFPLKKDVVCKLQLTFEYGADDPYKLVFVPRDNSFMPVRVVWQHTKDIIVTDAPAPEYPPVVTWADLQNFPKHNSDQTQNLLDWARKLIFLIDSDLYIRAKPRLTGVICRNWNRDTYGNYYTFATCSDNSEISVFIHQDQFILDEGNYSDFSKGDCVSFELKEDRDGRYSGRKVAWAGYTEETHLKNIDGELARELILKIRKSLYFPVIQIWRDGRSIYDIDCPESFTETIEQTISYFIELLEQDTLPESIKSEIRFILACLHKDIPHDCVQWIIKQPNNGEIHEKRTMGFALGDVSQPWQQELLSLLVAKPTNDALRVLSYAIWREQHFVEKFSITDLQFILNSLRNILGNIKPVSMHDDKWSIGRWIRSTTEPLELLLGLLRTRASNDSQKKMLLQPHQKLTKEFAKQIERIIEIVAQSSIDFSSRIQISIEKPVGDCTPDLLYALRLYLTGDDGANTIHIGNISDDNHD